LGLSGVSVALGRLEVLLAEGKLENSFDGFTSRATLALGPTLEIAADAITPSGKAFLWKGGRREEEMSDSKWQEHWDFEGEIKLGEGLANVAIFKRESR
jgi:16S rRNA G527 N7-methylase RsmG